MRQTIKARYHDGILQPLEPLVLADDAEVQVTVETTAPISAEDILSCGRRLPRFDDARDRTGRSDRLGPPALLS